MAAVEIARTVKRAGHRIHERVVVGGIDFALDDRPRLVERFPYRAEPLRRAAKRVAALPSGIAGHLAAQKILANVRGHR